MEDQNLLVWGAAGVLFVAACLVLGLGISALIDLLIGDSDEE